MEFNSTAAASSFFCWKPLHQFILFHLPLLSFQATLIQGPVATVSLFPRVQFNLYSFQVSISCLPKKWSAAANSLHPVKFTPFSFLFQILYQLLQEVVCCCEFPTLCKVRTILSFWLPIYYTKSSQVEDSCCEFPAFFVKPHHLLSCFQVLIPSLPLSDICLQAQVQSLSGI